MITRLSRVLKEVKNLPPYHRAMRSYGSMANYTQRAYGKHPRQYVLHRPSIIVNAPVAVWFHGGGWQFGAPDRLLGFGEYFHDRGYEVYLPSHRRLPRFGGSQLYIDALHAIQSIDRAAQPCTPLLLGGISSGGHLASLLAFRQNTWARNLHLSGLLIGAAPLSLRDIGWSPQVQRLAGRRRSKDFSNHDPLQVLDHKPNFPALVIHGTHDGLVPYASAAAFSERAAELDWTDFELHTLPGGSHLDATTWVWRH